MEHNREIFILICCVFASLVTSITISPNGNSPEIKMNGGIMTDSQKDQGNTKPLDIQTLAISKQTRPKSEIFPTKLAINERYRRLIPYMTFYYANDLTLPLLEHTKIVEVEKAEIVEAKELDEMNQRQPKKIVHSPPRNIPRYQGNRLTQFNLASANPTKIFYKDGIPYHRNPNKITPNYNPLLQEYVLIDNNYNTGRIIPKPFTPTPTVSPISRKPYVSIYKPEEAPNVRYYLTEKEIPPRYKLIPYEQTPPVKVKPYNENVYDTKKPYAVPVLVPREQVYIKPRPNPQSPRLQYFYDPVNNPSSYKKQPTRVSNKFYEKEPLPAPPSTDDGFKPIPNPKFTYTTDLPKFVSTTSERPVTNAVYEIEKIVPETHADDYIINDRDTFYQDGEQSAANTAEYTNNDNINLTDLIKFLQQNRSIPKPITKENVGASIRILLQALNALKSAPEELHFKNPVISNPETQVTPKNIIADVTYTSLDDNIVTSSPAPDNDNDIPQEPYLANVNIPSQHLDDVQAGGGTVQHFPLQVTSDEEGGTPGRPGIDYPILTTIPETAFDCKTQRYKGFFADTETRCQVWHYCDLNGGQASFLCPNGTIFSQAGLTCDWWFNVKCSSTTQLYVLNESLYKFILPHSPKFPEDFSGPLVDKYLTLKFKEMEEQFSKNKKKQNTADKDDADSSEESDDKETDEAKNVEHREANKSNIVSEASVIIESDGTSGNVERLEDIQN